MEKEVKKIIHTADWHLEPTENHDRFRDFIGRFISSIEKETKGYHEDEVLIVIVGDLFDNKSKKPSHEADDLMDDVLMELTKRWKTIVTIGNHDYDRRNKSKLDCITPIANSFKRHGNDRLVYLKKSKHFEYLNLLFFNYSNFEDNKPPAIKNIKKMIPNKINIGLYHDMLSGSKDFKNVDVSEHNADVDSTNIFEGLDFVLLGDIHKHQTIQADIPIVYCGSPEQLHVGESVNGHGYCIWDVEKHTYEFIELNSDWGCYKFRCNSINDIDNNLETITNLN